LGLFRLEDMEGSLSAVMFADPYERYGAEMTDEAIVFAEGAVDLSRDEPSLKVERLIPLARAAQTFATRVTLRLPGDAAGVERVLTPVRSLLERHRGGCEVLLDVPGPGGVRAIVRAASHLCVTPSPGFRTEAEELLGRGSLRIR
jgi:DNA polymerase III alpha subunit